MVKYNNMYKKARKYYENGELKKSANVCDVCLQKEPNNAEVLNLKALMMYIDGELEKARALWSLNKNTNNNEIAISYLNASKNDKENYNNYLEAKKLIAELKFQEAIEILIKCCNSDFNLINVNNEIATCYLKIEDFISAKLYIDKVLTFDKNDEIALENKRVYIERIGDSEEKNIKKKKVINRLAIAAVVVFLMVIVVDYVKVHNKYKANVQNNLTSKVEDKNATMTKEEPQNNEQKQASEEEAKKQEEVKKQEEAKKQEEEKKQQENKYVFEADKLHQAIDGNDFNTIFAIYDGAQGKELNDEQKGLLQSAKEKLDNDGIENFYQGGFEKFQASDFQGALDLFTKGYKYSDNNYLHEHLMYMLGATYVHLNDSNKMIEYFNEYIQKCTNGEYYSTVLYELMDYYADKDLGKAKEYANKIKNEASDSIYNNDHTDDILARQ